MPWYSGLVIILLFLAGCVNNQPKIGKKMFDKEDEFIVKGILAEENNTSQAISIFNQLYTKTNKYVYLKELIKLSFDKKDYNKTIKLVDEFIKKYPKKSTQIIRYKIYSYIKLNKLNIALQIAKNFLKNHRDLNTYELIAYIYIQKKDYKNGIKYLKSAYSISHSAKVLAQMGDIFFKDLKKPNEAVSYYQTHIRLYGCDSIICERLANIYQFLYDYDNLRELYKKMYHNTNNIMYANKVVYLYLEEEKYNEAIKFIKKNKLDKNILYMVYKSRFERFNNYKDAYKLYRYTKDYKYFFLYTVLKFQKSKKGLLDIKNLISNLEILLKNERKPIYLNYLGYVLIDYDIDVKKGIKLIKEALETNPNSAEFLDSLAWGYYKLKECKKAYDIISKIKLNDEEINKHKKLIRRCYDSTKNNKQNKRKSKKRKKH